MIAFCDIDGVLADFNKRAFEVLGLHFAYNHLALRSWDWPTYFGLDLLKDVDPLCDEEFWAGMEWMPDGREILATVEATFNDVYLLTSPMPNSGAWTGKMRWIKEHIPHYANRVIMTRAPKHLLASPDRVLIDDNDDNVTGWGCSGGQAILVPRPWNTLSHLKDYALPIVKTQLGAI